MRASIPRRIERLVERFDHTTIDYKGNDDFRYDMKQISTASGCDNKKKIIVRYFPQIAGVKNESVPSDVSSSMSSCSRPPTPRTMHSGLFKTQIFSYYRLSGNRLPLIFTIVLELLTFTRVLGDIQGACIH